MYRVAWLPLLLVGLAFILLVAPETTTPPAEERGYASAYGPGVMDATVRYRLETGVWWNPLPVGWYTVHGYVATNDCRQVGRVMTLVDPAGREYRVLVADCGGDDGGSEWMTSNGIVAELDWRLWERLITEHGRPLRVSLR
jgi:hypothetical protein